MVVVCVVFFVLSLCFEDVRHQCFENIMPDLCFMFFICFLKLI